MGTPPDSVSGTGRVDGTASWSPPPATPPSLRRALAFLAEHTDRDIRLADIAAASGIRSRGLQDLFRRHLGMTPMEVMRELRLDRAHRALGAASATGTDTVAAIAARYGFHHAGRFSLRYRERYGCSPATTLRS